MAKEERPKEQVVILDVRDVPSTDPARIGRLDVMVTYRVDPAHIYMITIPKEKFDEKTLKATIRKDLEEKRKWIGKQLEV